MNRIQLGLLKNKLPSDNDLTQRIARIPANKEEVSDQDVAQQIRIWIRWRIFFLVVTFLFYALHYYRKHNYFHEQSNIFKALKQANTALKKIIPTKNEKTSRGNTRTSHFDYIDDESSEDCATSYKNQTATSKAVKEKQNNRKIRIDFEKNIRLCYGLKNGSFIIQHQDYKVEIIDRDGNNVCFLDAKPLAEISAFSQLDNGTIVAGGKDLEENTAVIFLWGDAAANRIPYDDDNIYSLDTYKNLIAFSTENRVIVINTTENSQYERKFGKGKVLFTSDTQLIFYTENTENEKAYMFQYDFRYYEQCAAEYITINHGVRLPDNKIMLTHGTSCCEFSIRKNSGVILEDIVNEKKENWHPINHLAISPNGKFLAASNVDGYIRLWDTTTFKTIRGIDTGEVIL